MMQRPPACLTCSASPEISFYISFESLEFLSRADYILVVRVAEAGRFGYKLFAVALAAHLGLRKELCVTAEHDIGSASRHVRGYRDRAELTCLRDDLRFLFMVLGVEHFMLYAALLRSLLSVSDFSMDIVPTSTG